MKNDGIKKEVSENIFPALHFPPQDRRRIQYNILYYATTDRQQNNSVYEITAIGKIL